MDALHHIAKENLALSKRIKILLVGSGTEETVLREQAAKNGIAEQVIFAGAVSHREAARYMKALDVFVLPSRTMPNWKEQFGRVIIEAMACAIPVIGSDSGEIPNLIRATGGGLVFRERDVTDLAAKMVELCQETQKRVDLGARGARAVAEHYSLDAVASRLHTIFRDTIGSYKPAT